MEAVSIVLSLYLGYVWNQLVSVRVGLGRCPHRIARGSRGDINEIGVKPPSGRRHPDLSVPLDLALTPIS